MGVVKVEEEEGEDEYEILPWEVSPGSTQDLHPSYGQGSSCPTAQANHS